MKFIAAVKLVRKTFPGASVEVKTVDHRNAFSGTPWREVTCYAVLPDRTGRPYVLTFHQYPGRDQADSPYLRPADRQDDPYSDYHAGDYFPTVPAALASLLYRGRIAYLEIDGQQVDVRAEIEPRGVGLTPVGKVTLTYTSRFPARNVRIVQRKNVRDKAALAVITAFLDDESAAGVLVDFIMGVEA